MPADDARTDAHAIAAWRAILELVGWGGQRRPPRFPAVAARLGLAPKQMGVLWKLEPGATMPMRAIGESLHCDASYVTDLVDRLEERGLIERRPSPADRRVTLIALTAEGESCRDEALAMLYEPPEEFAALDGDELRRLGELLGKVVAADVSREESPPAHRAPRTGRAGALPSPRRAARAPR